MKGEATPLYYAAMAGSEPAVDLLLLYGGDAQNSNSGEKVVEHEVWFFDTRQYVQITLFMLVFSDYKRWQKTNLSLDRLPMLSGETFPASIWPE